MPGMKTVTGMQGVGNARDLAEMLRQLGRGPDTMLAHITPEEAMMLRSMGGAGTQNPMTGLPEFQPQGDYNFDLGSYEDIAAATPQDYEFDAYGPTADRVPSPAMAPMAPQPLDFQGQDFGFGYGQPGEYGIGYTPQPQVTPEISPFQRLAERGEAGIESLRQTAQKYPNISRLLATGAASLPALLNAARMRRETGRATSELRAMSAPIRQEAEALRQQARAGVLTPQQASQQEAQRARLRQSAATRGTTTGTQQAMIENQLATQRAQLSQTNLENALRQLNLANTVDEAAIRAKLQGDAQTAAALEGVMQNLFRALSSSQQQAGQRPAQTTRQAPASALPEEQLFPAPRVRS